MSFARACAKLILMGEHAVVYQQPALALPLPQLEAQVRIEASESAGILLEAPDLPALWDLPEPPQSSPEPLIETLVRALDALQAPWPACTVRIESKIPVARGLGSGTAVTTALWRAMANYCNVYPGLEQSLDFVQGMDQLYHGRPSGIDAQVIVREMPLRFMRPDHYSSLDLAQPLSLLVADSGQQAATRTQVEKVAEWRLAQPERSEWVFQEIGALVARAESCLAKAEMESLGILMNRNQELLIEMGVSTDGLNQLCSVARQAGALGAKLSGAGGGGVVVCLVSPESQHSVSEALNAAGAVAVYQVRVPAREEING
ncbi:mevalonate kinase [bacterium (Candidatus Blackallbacteria) CG17_big_fil_post_rev_8_21_14_2_50_48_46]|uniref:Mevalonate kinase n=1 Tax=bacterium (Candidatus Blackallbacteria) CG17_big_fil_post_rev_8_21_14_2_50_48_46 TaxID=2014261 RepID=A0A2M7G9L1_9BACT|nr:MAG: mevalonate kinase [bacterium (Candidatus Blackallbacteria) CG18_big_fil_WC_8_21_14_2_50_49_26]PIW18554.1 MAG: mevalonate kinase [bacterium (Candidatus Blackallbacteria) CG17_big_fil_post_rev_8_21_14_2_50_48_46]PIW46461.1 MAG: mevalonate kinase [bacterium (Candidatus Blackallbacteria) CG13_big_fil_rev_8_21_14_2_50_49_14]